MKIYSWNVNGLRAVHRKGALQAFIQKEKPDAILFQEIKVKEEQLPEDLPNTDYQTFYNPAEKPGYSGVAIWLHNKYQTELKEFKKGMPRWKDGEGRAAQCILKNGLVLISVYVPNGGKSPEAYQDKLTFFKLLAQHAKTLMQKGHQVAICGDFNVARSELDLEEPEKHRDHTHFNEEVRAHMEKLTEVGMIDSYRIRNPDKKGAYSYWDNFSFSLPKGVTPREVNNGWRIDYCLLDPTTNEQITSAKIHQKILGSDHCPVSFSL